MRELHDLGLDRVEKTRPDLFDERVAIVGSRAFPYLDLVRAFVGRLPETAEVVSGGAEGVDRVAVDAARERGLRAIECLPDERHPIPQRFFKRNLMILRHITRGVLVAFVTTRADGTLTGGSMHTVRNAQPRIPTVVYVPQIDPVTRKHRLFAYENQAMMGLVSFPRSEYAQERAPF